MGRAIPKASRGILCIGGLYQGCRGFRRGESMPHLSFISFPRHAAVLVLASATALPVWAQQAQSTAPVSQSTPSSAAQQQPSPAAEKPLTPPKEGFWGHVNPFASKKWVKKQTDPLGDRLTELDEVNARNARDIQDVDARAQAGISKAQAQADAANQTATTANQEALNANNVAQDASGHVDRLNTKVKGLDQYQQVSDLDLRFRGGSPMLTADSRAKLDQLAAGRHRPRRLHPGDGSALACRGQRRHPEFTAPGRSGRALLSNRTPDSRLPHALRGSGQRPGACDRRRRAKAGAGEGEQRAFAVDGKQFGGPGRSVPPERFCHSVARSSRKPGSSSPEALLRANGTPPSGRQPSSRNAREPRQLGPRFDGGRFFLAPLNAVSRRDTASAAAKIWAATALTAVWGIAAGFCAGSRSDSPMGPRARSGKTHAAHRRAIYLQERHTSNGRFVVCGDHGSGVRRGLA